MLLLNKKILRLCSALIVVFSAVSVQAGLVLSGTRVIYPSNESEISLKVENKSALPLLAQSWIDAGNEKSTPETSDVPFMILPPMARIEPNKAQTLRISFTKGHRLPADRETLYWLNVLEVPPKSKGDGNYLTVAYRNRIKLFYRPAALKGNASESFDKVTWLLHGDKLTGKNPTPYYVNYAGIIVKNDSGVSLGEVKGGMIAPNSQQEFTVKSNNNKGIASKIVVKAINDYGAFVEKTGLLAR